MNIPPIQNLIDKALKPEERERSGKWNPSKFGYCYRAQYWNRKDEPKSNPPDARTYRVFKAGYLFEEFVTSLLQNYKPELQVKVEEEDVLGYSDIVIGNEAMDVKSQHSKSFWYMDKPEFNIIEDKKGNWLQVLYYAYRLKKDYGRLIFISKDDLCIKEFIQPVNKFWVGEIENELKELRRIWKANKLPPAKPRCKKKKNGYWMCNYCDFKDKCFELENKK